MRKVIATAAIAAAASVSACSHAQSEDVGPTVSRNYNVGNFNQLELAGHYYVDIRTGSAVTISAKGPEKLMDKLVVEVRGDKLLIHPEKERRWWGGHSNWKSRDKVQVVVTVPSLSAATLAGSGGIRIDKVQGDKFDGQIAGSGDMNVGSIDVGILKLGIAGSGSVTGGAGKAKSAEYDIAGSGDVNAGGVAVEALKVSIAGSGGIKANASGTADVDIMGSGDVEVTGGAKCTTRKAGSGSVRCS